MAQFIVFDSVMGNGKTSAMLHFLQSADYERDRYLVVVPLLTEVNRWKLALENNVRKSIAPESGKKNKTKTSDLKELFRYRTKIIIITHAMFDRFDSEMIDLMRDGEYTLIIDEVPTPIRRIDMKKGDLAVYIKAGVIIVNPETNRVSWSKEFENEESDFAEVRDLCATGNVMYNPKTKAIYKISPYDVYLACKQVYILTYMFEAQVIYYYLAQREIPYKKYSVYYDEEAGHHALCDYDECFDKNNDWKSLIHICDSKRMNAIGEKRNALSMNWFKEHPSLVKTLKKNVYNFSRNMCKAKSSDVLWTTYIDYKDGLVSNGFKKGFLALNAKATNDFSDRTAVNYVANRFVSPDIKNYFNLEDDELKFDEDAFALSEMLQFIWRSAIRNGKPINLYIPSSRMRGLLEKWIDENSVTQTA